MRPFFSYLLLILFCIQGLNSHAQSSDRSIAQNAENYLVQLQALNRFRGVVLIARNGKPVYRQAFGFANLEDSVRNRVDTRFPVASLTKPFTAAAILLLKDRQLLHLDDPVSKFIDDAPEDWKTITIHHLLSHSSGIADYTDDSLWMVNRSCGIDFTETYHWFRNKPVLFQPGARYSYSNSGYVLLGYIIEKLTGMSYERFIRENLLLPLEMKNTFIDDNKQIIPRRAQGYVRDGLELHNFPYLNMNISKSAGAIVSTLDDLLKWDQSFYTGKLLSEESRRLMFTRVAGDYGYGWHMHSLHGKRRMTVSGGMLGYKTNMDRFPDEKLTIIILCNSYDVFINAAIRDLAAIALGKNYSLPAARKEIILSRERSEVYRGTYLSDDGQKFIIEDGKNNQLSVRYNNRTYPLKAESEMAFFSTEYDAQLMFTVSTDGKELVYNKKLKARKQVK